jgi:ABC-type nitrate/sulfonate/bicarbonate transport system permease component
MAKGVPLASYALIGEVPEILRHELSHLGQLLVLTETELGRVSADTLSHLHALIIGANVDAHTLSVWLPSLRTVNPTMGVVGIDVDPRPKDMTNWVDEVLSTQEAVRNYVDQLSQRRRQSTVLHLLAEIAGRVGAQIGAIIGLVALWWLAVVVFNPPPFLLPSPGRVLDAFFAQWARFTMHVLVTAYEATLGFLVGNSLGIGLAIVLSRFVRLQRFTMPVLISFQAVPIVAFAPLLGVWLGTGLASKVAMAAIICFFPMVVNALHAFGAVEREYLELFALFRSSYANMFKRLLLPAGAPALIAALKISAGLSVVGAIVAEMTGAERGLGYLILNGAYRLETDIMFAAMLLSGLLGVAFFHVPEIVRTLLPRTWTRGLTA